MKFIRFLLVLLCVFPCLAGCSKQGNPEGRLDVSGTVTFNGSPFGVSGSYDIAFVSVDDPSAGPSRAPIDPTTGKFKCTMQDGLKPGKYRVKFSAMAEYDKRTNKPIDPEYAKNADVGEGVKVGYYVSLLPPDFNENSTIEFEAVGGKKNVFDYNIETSYVPNTEPPR